MDTNQILIPLDPVCIDDYVEVVYSGPDWCVMLWNGKEEWPIRTADLKRDYRPLRTTDKEVLRRLT